MSPVLAACESLMSVPITDTYYEKKSTTSFTDACLEEIKISITGIIINVEIAKFQISEVKSFRDFWTLDYRVKVFN